MIKGDNGALSSWVRLAALVLLVGALHLAGSITMPLAMAAFVVVLIWPLQAWLARYLPMRWSALLAFTAMLLALALLGAVFWICVEEVASKAGQYRQLFGASFERLDAGLSRHHLPSFKNHFNADRLMDHAMALAGQFAASMYQISGFMVLVIVFVGLMLIEVDPFSRRLKGHLDYEKAQKLENVVRGTSMSIHRFMLTRTLTSSIVGVMTGLFAWSIGLDFPVVWGVLSFVLNYIPFLGAIAAVIPPSLVALVQPDPFWVRMATPIGLTLIHFVIGNYIDPMLQGQYLSLPPFLVFYSIVFWGWVWGIPGAVIGVPLTMAVLIMCQHFESTRWLARLLLKNSD